MKGPAGKAWVRFARRWIGRGSVVLGALLFTGCQDDPGAPAFRPEDPQTDTTVMKLVFIPGSDKPVVRFYEWEAPIPATSGPFIFGVGGVWRLMDHPPPGVGAGAAAASTSPGGTSLSSASAAGAGSLTALAGTSLGLFTGGQSETGDPSSTLAYLYDLATDAFTVTSLTTARADHRMTTLLDGRVLVTGGFGPPSASVALASAELFDPVARTFTPAGDLNQARGFHQATLLTNGRVFISGAVFVDGPGWVNTTELFDPTTGMFATVDDEPGQRWDRHAAVRLDDGRVLLLGGNESNKSEFFDPTTESFSPGPDLNAVHGYGLSATLLFDGRVLVVGGVEQFGGIPTAVAEVFDPTSGSWTQVQPLSTPRRNHTALLAPDGTVLIAGGQNEDEGFLTTSEFFDPATNTFMTGPELPVEMVGGAAVVLSR